MKLKLAVAAVGLALSYPAFADYASTYQSGSDNYIGIEQVSSGAGAGVTQIGNNNNVGYNDGTYEYPGVFQYYVGWGWTSIYQQGEYNNAWVTQIYGNNMNAQIQQGGARWEGETVVDYGNAFGNYASVYQYAFDGANNSASVFQAGSYNSMWSNQQGSDNQLSVFQNGYGNLAAGLSQYGWGGDANVMNVRQTGTSNRIYYSASQYGSGNEMNITQNGTGNWIGWAQQGGTDNLLNISQTGVAHSVYASQFGNNNTTRINQY